MLTTQEKENPYINGFKNGQRKLAYCILEMNLESMGDYQSLLSHLKEVAEGREIIDNSVIGFTSF